VSESRTLINSILQDSSSVDVRYADALSPEGFLKIYTHSRGQHQGGRKVPELSILFKIVLEPENQVFPVAKSDKMLRCFLLCCPCRVACEIRIRYQIRQVKRRAAPRAYRPASAQSSGQSVCHCTIQEANKLSFG
jgi:hypothetical protein